MSVSFTDSRGPEALPPLARTLLDQVDTGVLLFDAAGRLTFANAPARAALPLAAHATGDGPAVRALALARGGRAVSLGPAGEAVLLDGAASGTLADRERAAILQALAGTHGRLAETARRLGISRTTLWRRLKQYGMGSAHATP
jgi:transcriptional regulator of acetoin/glycerol metabolism